MAGLVAAEIALVTAFALGLAAAFALGPAFALGLAAVGIAFAATSALGPTAVKNFRTFSEGVQVFPHAREARRSSMQNDKKAASFAAEPAHQ